MEKNIVMIIVVCCAFIIVGIVTFIINLYKLVVIDATSRNIPKARFWGVVSLGGNNSSGLLLYLIKRRNFPVIELSKDEKIEKDRRKQTIKVGFLFTIIPLLIMIYTVVLIK